MSISTDCSAIYSHLPYYGHLHNHPIPVRDLVGRLDGQWMVKLYPSPDHQLYGCTHQTVQCTALITSSDMMTSTGFHYIFHRWDLTHSTSTPSSLDSLVPWVCRDEDKYRSRDTHVTYLSMLMSDHIGLEILFSVRFPDEKAITTQQTFAQCSKLGSWVEAWSWGRSWGLESASGARFKSPTCSYLNFDPTEFPNL